MNKTLLSSLLLLAGCADQPFDETTTMMTDDLTGDVMYSFEAESASLTLPMSRQSDGTASQGAYIAVPPNISPGGSAHISFDAPYSSDHLYGWIRIMTPASGDAWITVSLDGQSSHFEDTGIPSWQWLRVPNINWSATPGNHTIVITSDVADVRIDRVMLVSNPVYEPTMLTVQAEGGGLLAPMQIGGSAMQYLSPRYVYAPVGSPRGGLDRMNTPMTQYGSRFVWGLVSTTSASANSFLLSANAGPKMAWTLPVTGGAWTWTKAPAKLDYGQVLDSFTDIEPLEDGAKLDKLIITNDPGFVPVVVQTIVNAPN